jgi:hypothetical protein
VSAGHTAGVIARVDKTTFKAVPFATPTPQGAGPVSARLAMPASTSENPADRILLTFLALGLMLLAFFVVLTASATFDQRRMREVVQSVQTVFVAPRETATPVQNVPVDAALEAAVSTLRANVSDIFSGMVPRDTTPPSPGKSSANPDRVEIDVPMPLFFAADEAVLYPLPVLDSIVAVLGTPLAGYRMELVVRAAGDTLDPALDGARIAALADGLVRRGLASTALSVGTLQNASDNGVRALRFTFLLLTDDDDHAAVRMMTGKGTP